MDEKEAARPLMGTIFLVKQEVKLSSVVCPYEGFKSMVVKVIKTQEMCKL